MTKNPEELTRSLHQAWAVIERLKGKIKKTRGAERSSVAVVGMACRFPGGAETPDLYWELIREGKSGLGPIPADRWDREAYFDPDPGMPGKIYVETAGFISNVDLFDAEFFRLSGEEARSLDPQHRLLLEMGWEALENAGFEPGALRGLKAGVFVGLSQMDYAQFQFGSQELRTVDAYSNTGNGLSFAAGRLSYFFGFHGPSLVVDTACSSSLVAVHQAVESLNRGECDLALVGGAQLLLRPETFVGLSRMRVLAADGVCKPFDERADGYGRGEGVGMVVLMREADAREKGHTPLALIRGSAVNHGGAASGFTAPNGSAQRALIRSALEAAGVSPQAVSYVECHGTGTRLGDPVEVEALARTYRPAGEPARPLFIGSVKANIGHLEAASGVASLIKTVLVLRHGMVPPQRGLEALNPDIPWGEFGVEVPRTAKEFPKEGGGGRFGGVSSFGIGGTNAHVVLEGCDEEVAAQSPAALVLPLSAHCPEALREMAAGYAAAFARANAMEARDICLHTARTRGEMSHRLVVVGEDQASLGRGLADYLAGRNSASCFEGSVNTKRRHKVAFLFTGQGTQHAGMGSRLYDEEPVFREVIDRCQARIERGRQGISLRDFFAANDENGAALAKSAFMQPALYALQCGLLELLKSCGVEADVVMGHSAGEYAAACAAGIFSVEDGLDMLIERGYLTDTFVKPGAMLSVLCSHAQLEPILRECSARVWVAAFNGPSSVVLSGTPDEIRAVRAVLQRERVLTQGIEVGHPFHSSLIEPILPRLEERFSGIGLHRPRIPFVSSVTGALVESEPSEARYWREHSRLPVSFAQGIATVHELGVRVFVEIGPRPMLLSMARGCIPEGKDLFWLPALRPTVSAPTQLARLLGALHALGVPVNWAAREGGNAVPRARLSLPRYPFQRKSHWVEQGRTAPRPLPRPSGAFSLPGRRLPGDEGETHERSWVCRVDPVLGKWLGAHAIGADWAVSFAGLVKWVFAAAAAAPRARLPTIAPLKVLEPLLFGAEGRDVLTHWAASESNGARLTIWNADGNDWARSAWAQLREPGDLSAEPLATVRERLGVAAWEEPDGREPDLEVRFFRAVRFWKTERESLGLFAIHGRELGDGSCEECHPAILDGLAKTFRQVAPPGLDAMVPTAAAEIEWRGKITERVWCHAILGGEHAESGLLGDLFVHDEKGQLVVGIRGLRFVPATLRRDELASLAYRISLETVGTPVADEPRLRNSFWHVAGEGDALQAAILHELRLAGARCDGWSTLSREGRDKTGGESLEVIFVAGGHEGPDDCLRLLTLQRELTALRESRIGLWVYTCGAQNGDTPWAATVWGLARSIFREHAAWDGGVCDLDPQDDVGARSVAILSTLGRTQRSGSCWRGRQLSDVVLEPTWSLDRCRPLVLKEDRSYLITGGLGGIGRELAGWLCGKGARRLLLVGRSEPDSTAEAMLESWRSGGIEVETFRGDVGDARDCERLESLPWLRVHPPAGIFHLAGILRDVPLSDESEEGFRRTLSGKAQGAWHLHELSRAWDLDHFVLFSSVAGLVPNVGQAAYASANAFLDGLAVHRRKVGLPALSVDWGTWARVGHAASAHGARVHAELANRGVLPIESDTAFQILESLMGCEEAQTGVIRADFRRLVRVDRDLARWSLLRRVLGEDTAGGVDARPQFGSLATPELRERIRRELREKLAFVLELRELPGVDAGFRDLGLDSFVGLRFRSDVERTFGCSLPVTAIFEFPTVAELTEYLLSLIRPGSAAAAAEDRDLPQEVAEVTVPGPVGSKLERLESLLNRFNGARDA